MTPQCNGQNDCGEQREQKVEAEGEAAAYVRHQKFVSKKDKLHDLHVDLKVCRLVAQTFAEAMSEEEKTSRRESQAGRQQTGRGGITGAGLQGELLVERITGSSMGDM